MPGLQFGCSKTLRCSYLVASDADVIIDKEEVASGQRMLMDEQFQTMDSKSAKLYIEKV